MGSSQADKETPGPCVPSSSHLNFYSLPYTWASCFSDSSRSRLQLKEISSMKATPLSISLCPLLAIPKHGSLLLQY